MRRPSSIVSLKNFDFDLTITWVTRVGCWQLTGFDTSLLESSVAAQYADARTIP